jgi:hypothetical protein
MTHQTTFRVSKYPLCFSVLNANKKPPGLTARGLAEIVHIPVLEKSGAVLRRAKTSVLILEVVTPFVV